MTRSILLGFIFLTLTASHVQGGIDLKSQLHAFYRRERCGDLTAWTQDIPHLLKDGTPNIRREIFRFLLEKKQWPEAFWKELPTIFRGAVYVGSPVFDYRIGHLSFQKGILRLLVLHREAWPSSVERDLWQTLLEADLGSLPDVSTLRARLIEQKADWPEDLDAEVLKTMKNNRRADVVICMLRAWEKRRHIPDSFWRELISLSTTWNAKIQRAVRDLIRRRRSSISAEVLPELVSGVQQQERFLETAMRTRLLCKDILDLLQPTHLSQLNLLQKLTNDK